MSKPSATDTFWDNIKQIFFAIILAILIKTSIVEAYKIPSQSMEDTLLVGDFLVANKFVYGARLPLVNWQLPAISDPERGDVVIFIWPVDGQTKYIKRCIGIPGDTIFIKNKELFVNGKPVALPDDGKIIDTFSTGAQRVVPRKAGGRDSRDNFGPYVVPRDTYFMLGDNRDNSYDSRFWDCVPKQNILGEAMLIHWSWNDDIFPSPEVSPTNPLSVPRMFLYNAVHFFQKVRWERLLNIIS